MLNDASLRQGLTAAQQQALTNAGRLAVGFKYERPPGAMLRNHASVARLSRADAQRILTTPCVCERRRHTVREFIPAGHEHVVTCDARIITDQGGRHDTALVDRLRWLFERVVMSQAVRSAVLEEVSAALVDLARKVPGLGPARAWVLAVKTRVQHMLDSQRRFGDSRVLSASRRAHTPGTWFVVWEDAMGSVVAGLQRSFVITTADKIGKNFVVVCKKCYVKQVLDDLQSGLFYAERLDGTAAVVSQLTAGLQQHCSGMLAFGIGTYFSLPGMQQVHGLATASRVGDSYVASVAA